MNDFQLDAQLKAIRVPGRNEDYWDDFPRQVTVTVRRISIHKHLAGNWLPRVAWLAGPALACCLLGFCIARSDAPKTISHLLQHQHEIRVRLAQLPASIRSNLRTGHGLESLVADQQ